MSRRRWTVLITLVIVLVIVPITCVVALVAYDWNREKPWLEARATRSLGRAVELGGDVDLLWRWRRRVDGTETFSPGFALTAADVRIDNPAWATRKRFAELASLDMDVRLLPLLRHRLVIPALRLVRPKIDLEQRKDGANTWTFTADGKDEGSAWRVDVGEIVFDEGDVAITDEKRALDVRATITRLDAPIPFGERAQGDDPSTRREVIQRVGREAAERLRKASEERAAHRASRGRDVAPPPYAFAWKASGKIGGERVTGEGRMGAVLALDDPRPFPLRADIDFGATSIALTGTITDPTSPDAIDMRLWIAGPNLAKLYAITGISLPNTPPYASVGRLAGHFRPGRSVMRYEDFTARVGGSDLAGTLKYRAEGERPVLSGDVDSALLQFRDLGTLIGASPDNDTSDRLLPDTPFNVEHWKAMDADVHFTGKRVVRTEELPINDVDTTVRMQAGVLTLDPLRFVMAGGNVTSSIRVDANASPPKGVIAIDGAHLKLHRLFENVGGLSHSPGEISGKVKLAGAGKSIAGILGNADGSLRVLTTGGRVSETLMEEAGLNFANVLIAKMKGDQMIDIDCAAADLKVDNGVAKPELFVFDTENAIVVIDGTVDLGDERVDLTLHPETKNVRIFSLRSPLHVTGNFGKLDVSVDKKTLLARGGGAIALGVLAAPLAALAPLIAPGGSEETQSCAPLVEELSKTSPDAKKKATKG
ncbi:MAG TPA: AsmA family protein [Rhodanobacteraceae bacterium]